jgi:hypothetical protein
MSMQLIPLTTSEMHSMHKETLSSLRYYATFFKNTAAFIK